MIISIISSIIAFLSALAAILSAIISYKYYKRSSKTAERLVDIEEGRELDRKKARLTAEIERKREQVSGSISHVQWWVFKIENKGYASARDVNVLIGDKKFDECGFFDKKLIKHIGAESICTYKFKNTDFRHKTPLHCLITWEDDSGKQGKWEHDLTEN